MNIYGNDGPPWCQVPDMSKNTCPKLLTSISWLYPVVESIYQLFDRFSKATVTLWLFMRFQSTLLNSFSKSVNSRPGSWWFSIYVIRSYIRVVFSLTIAWQWHPFKFVNKPIHNRFYPREITLRKVKILLLDASLWVLFLFNMLWNTHNEPSILCDGWRTSSASTIEISY